MVIAIEGLPGAGKTTAATLLGERLEATVLVETTADHPFLEFVYDDRSRHDLQIELAFLVIHFGGYRLLDREGISVSDFSPVKDLLFAWDMLKGEDLEVFERAYERFYADHPLPDVVLILDLPPEECLARVRRRGRDFEQGMTLERLERMHALYREHETSLGQQIVRLDVPPHLRRDEVTDLLLANLKGQHLAHVA
jgi:deoxyguanosine kinase